MHTSKMRCNHTTLNVIGLQGKELCIAVPIAYLIIVFCILPRINREAKVWYVFDVARQYPKRLIAFKIDNSRSFRELSPRHNIPRHLAYLTIRYLFI